jgi:glycerate 2-kinase
LDIIEKTLNRINPYDEVLEKIKLKEDILSIDSKEGVLSFDLKKINNIFVLGGGKGSLLTALGLNVILKDKIKRGIITVKGIESQRLGNLDFIKAGHPLPDEGSFKAARELIRIAKSVNEKDLVFFVGSSGTSSMICLPVEGISLGDIQILYKLLLDNINNIEEINCVRKHVSVISGGRLGQHIFPGIILNFQPGNEKERFKTMPWPDLIWEDPTTFSDAIYILKKYNIWDNVPLPIQRHLLDGIRGRQEETVKDILNLKIYNIPVSYRYAACDAAKKIAEDLGYNTIILASMLEGESREVGIAIASIAKEVIKFNNPTKPPCVLIAGGETSVKVVNKSGKGGRNQEFVLGVAGYIEGYDITVAAIDSEGTDGPTNVAGGIADGETMKKCHEKNINLFEQLNKNNSFYVLDTLGDHILTGSTNVAVQSLKVIVIH